MRQKFIDKVYMREVLSKEWYLEKDKQLNGYIALKYIKQISKPLTAFSNGKKYVGLDNGFSILEYVPLDRRYNCRVFFDDFNKPLCFYFDINNGSGEENGIPWYDDLYLDVTMECPAITETCYYIRLDDEAELKVAKKEGKISEQTYNQAYEIAIQLMLELRAQKNDLVNRCQFDLFRIKNMLGLK